jgi:hypothetical protein
MASFGEGLGAFIGAGMAADRLDDAQRETATIAGGALGNAQPYNQFGQSFLPKAGNAIDAIQARAGDVKGYDEFMKDYQASPGAQYLIEQANTGQENSAAARGKLLSGGNQRELAKINTGLSATFANQAYDQYLKGDSQQFGQLETALGNMFGAIGVGTTATGQQAAISTSQMNNQAAIAKSQAENDQKKGGGLGSMFSGLGSIAAMF